MQTNLAPSASLPFELGEPQSFGGLELVPLYPASPPRAEYVGLDEAAANGLAVTELNEAGAVETLLVTNTLGTAALLYEGEELAGAKQNRILERSILVAAGSKLEIPAKCVEQGRWAYRSRRRFREDDARLRRFFADLTKDGTPYSRLDRIVEGLFLGPSQYSIGLQCADLVVAITAAAERGGGQARGYLKTLLPRFARHPATGELDGVGIKRFPELVRRPREETRLFRPSR
jgi:hypothetical protein